MTRQAQLMKVSNYLRAPVLASFVCVAGVLGTEAAFAESEASQVSRISESGQHSELGRDWIEKMSHAMQNLNYAGTFVYLHGDEVETMKIFHSKLDGIEHERLVSLNGEAREIIRNADSVVCIWPGSKSVIVSKAQPRTPFPTFDPQQLSELERLYEFRQNGTTRVAGRLARVIDIAPRDSYRYGYRLWVDAETFLLLRSSMSDLDGKIVEQVMFTDVKYPERMPLEMFNASITGKEHKWLSNSSMIVPAEPAPEADIPGIVELDLPDGFEVDSDKITPVGGTDFTVRRLMYSDGLASLSVFIASAEDQSAGGILHGSSSMGGVHAFGVMRGQWHATVVGEVPLATVKMLAESLRISTR